MYYFALTDSVSQTSPVEIHYPFQRVHDFEGDGSEGDTVLLVAYSCKKKCIAKKDACGSCVLDVNARVFCTGGEIPSACLDECCKMA